MTQPVGSGFYYPPSRCYEDPIETAGQSFCRNASTVTEGYLCDESTARFQRFPLAEERLRRVRL